MRTFSRPAVTKIGVVALLLVSMLPFHRSVIAQVTDNSYTVEEYDITITWEDPWILDGEYPEEIVLERNNSMFLGIQWFDGQSLDPQEAVAPLLEDTVIEDRSNADPPRVTAEDDSNLTTTAEAYHINNGDVTVVVYLVTLSMFTDDALETVQNDIRVNGSPVLAGEPIADSGATTDLTGDATAETTRSTDETPEATEEATTEVVRTSRTGSDTTETPEVTEVATQEATEEVNTSQLETYTGPVYGYTVSYDPDIWTLDAELEDEAVDGIRLISGNSTYTIWAWDAYGDDPVACLDGEVQFYSSEFDPITDWEPVTDANGEPMRHESDTLAWGVFSLTYTNDEGVASSLVDYISCEPIPGQDAVLIVLLSSDPDAYNENLDAALDVLDTLEFADPE